MSDATPLEGLRIHDTADFCSLVPYLLGYQPEEQLVFVVVDGARIVLTGAVPLHCLERPDEARRQVLSAVRTITKPLVLLSCWSSDVSLAERALGAAEGWLGPEAVLDSVVVGDDRWRSRCGGAWAPQGPRSALECTPAVVQAVVEGMVTAPSREAVVAVVHGPDEKAAEAAREVYAVAEAGLCGLRGKEGLERACRLHHRGLGEASRRHDDRAAAAPYREAPGHARPRLDATELAELSLLVEDPEVRADILLALRLDDGPDGLALWSRVVALAPPEYASTPVGMLGFCAWLCGEGAVLVACVERILRLDPGSELGSLLAAINRDAVPPSRWEQARAQELFGSPGGRAA